MPITDLPKMLDFELINKRVLIREDLNVPLQNGRITDYSRIERALPTIKTAAQLGARVTVISHLGRPQEGVFDPKYSLSPVADALTEALQQKVNLVDNWLNGIEVEPGQVVLGENLRFLPGENDNLPTLAQQMAAQCDIFVMDAFATAHRSAASTTGVAQYAPIACAGPLLIEELNALSHVLEQPKRPLLAIIGGAKVSTKTALLASLIEQVDVLIVGGGIANTFLVAQGYPIGQSLYDPEWVDETKRLLLAAQQRNVLIALPQDAVVAELHQTDLTQATGIIKNLDEIDIGERILDIGPKTTAYYVDLIKKANTILWNGPVGMFEIPAFSHGTQAIGTAIAQSSAFSVAGGGDTLAALSLWDLMQKISYVSTGGGAFLALLEGDSLPAISILLKRVNA